MKRYSYPVFIGLLGVLMVYVFYMVWHSIDTPKNEEISEKPKVSKLLENKKVVSKNNSVQIDINHIKKYKHDIFEKKLEDENSVREESKRIYQNLTPLEYQEVNEKAAGIFDELDEDVIELEEELKYEKYQ